VIVAARRAATPATARGHDLSADAANQFFNTLEMLHEPPLRRRISLRSVKIPIQL
jgi:hypothetical protein